jgi:hypothetical protein
MANHIPQSAWPSGQTLTQFSALPSLSYQNYQSKWNAEATLIVWGHSSFNVVLFTTNEKHTININSELNYLMNGILFLYLC